MEELEKNGTSTQAEENTVSLASAQALADALAKIEVYTPTTWVDNSSPDIDAEHLNKPEQAIKRVTDALNSAVDVIKDLQSQVTKNAGDISTVNNNLSNQTDRVTQLYSEKITWCGNITDLSTLVSLSQQNKTVYIGHIDWRQTDILPSGSKSGTTICFASNWWIWALSGSKEFFCLSQEAKWEKAPYLLSNDLTDFQNKFFINMTNYTFDDLKKVYTGALPKIGFVGYSGPFTPNGQTGYVLCGGSYALLFSVNGDRYRYNAGIGDTAWVKLT